MLQEFEWFSRNVEELDVPYKFVLKEIKEFWRNYNKYKEFLMYFNKFRGKQRIFEEFKRILKKTIKN